MNSYRKWIPIINSCKNSHNMNSYMNSVNFWIHDHFIYEFIYKFGGTKVPDDVPKSGDSESAEKYVHIVLLQGCMIIIQESSKLKRSISIKEGHIVEIEDGHIIRVDQLVRLRFVARFTDILDLVPGHRNQPGPTRDTARMVFLQWCNTTFTFWTVGKGNWRLQVYIKNLLRSCMLY